MGPDRETLSVPLHPKIVAEIGIHAILEIPAAKRYNLLTIGDPERNPLQPEGLGMSDGAMSWRSWVACALLGVGIGTAILIYEASPAWAVKDWNRTDDPMKGGIGAHAGKIGGVGLAYKYPPIWWLNIQIAGAIWHTQDNKRHNIGLMLQYILRQDAKVRLYGAGGAGYFYHKKREDGDSYTTSEVVNAGLGVGVEYLLGERLSLQVEGDFTYEGDDKDIKFLPQLGVFFYF